MGIVPGNQGVWLAMESQGEIKVVKVDVGTDESGRWCELVKKLIRTKLILRYNDKPYACFTGIELVRGRQRTAGSGVYHVERGTKDNGLSRKRRDVGK